MLYSYNALNINENCLAVHLFLLMVNGIIRPFLVRFILVSYLYIHMVTRFSHSLDSGWILRFHF